MSFGGKSYISMNSCNFGVCSARITAGDIKLARNSQCSWRESYRENEIPSGVGIHGKATNKNCGRTMLYDLNDSYGENMS